MGDRESSDFRLGKSGVKLLLKEASGFRVADEAVFQVMVEEEVRIKKIAQAAQVIAEEAGRKTVLERDIRNAYKIHRMMREK